MPKRLLLLAAVALLAGLLAWLIADGSPQARRIDRLNAIVAAGKMYQLTGAEHETLSKMVTWLARAAGISNARTAINERYSTPNESAPVLHVYVTRPDQIGVTGCPAYNAIYDPELDAIFLDQSFITLSEWKQSLAAPDGEWGLDIPLRVKDVPSINVFFRFVLLHELGHRQLHRRNTTWYFSEAMSRQREEEADAFALEKMKAAFSLAPSFGIEAVEENTGILIDYPVKSDMPIDEQIEASLVEMIKVVLAAQLSLPSASATFAVARSHPNVISRLINLMDTAARTYRSEGLLEVLAQYSQLQARGVEALAKSRPLEIRSTLPITGLAWGGKTQGLLARTSANGLYRLPAEALAKVSAPGATLELDQALLNIPPSLGKRSTVWIKPDGSIVAPVPQRPNGQHYQKESLFPAFTLRNSDVMFEDDRVDLRGMMSVANPWPYALFHAAVGDRQWLVVLHENGKVQSAELSQLMEAEQKLVGAQKVALDFSAPTFAPKGIFFPIVTGKGHAIRFRGFGYVDAATMELQRVILPDVLDTCAYTTTENPLVDARFGLCQFSIRTNGSRERVFQAQLMPQPPDNWIGETYSYGERMEVWELSAGKPPHLVVSQPLMLSLARRGGISDDAMAKVELSPRFRYTGIDRANAKAVWFNLDGDSLYTLRLSNNLLETRFPFAGASLRLAEDDKGDLYAVELNGYKIFRLRMGQ